LWIGEANNKTNGMESKEDSMPRTNYFKNFKNSPKVKRFLKLQDDLYGTNPFLFLLILLGIIIFALFISTTVDIIHEPYLYKGNTYMTSSEVLQLLQVIPDNGTIQVYKPNPKTDTPTDTSKIPVSYVFRSTDKSVLDGALSGKIDLSPYYALSPLIFLGLLLVVLGLWQYYWPRKRLATLPDRIKIQGQKLTAETVKIIQTMSNNLFPKNLAHVTTIAPQFDKSIHGIIGIRTWRFVKNDTGNILLLSLYQKQSWDSPVFIADKTPELKNTSGIYSNVLIGQQQGNTSLAALEIKEKQITGLIENRGRAIEHDDGILRAQYAKIIFLAIHETDKDIAEALSLQYHVPVVISSGLLLLQDYPISRKEITVPL
jgi:hypothetical protein